MTCKAHFHFMNKDANGSYVGPAPTVGAYLTDGNGVPPYASGDTADWAHGSHRFNVPAGVNCCRLTCEEGVLAFDWGPVVNDYSPYAGSAYAVRLHAGETVDLAVSEGDVLSIGKISD